MAPQRWCSRSQAQARRQLELRGEEEEHSQRTRDGPCETDGSASIELSWVVRCSGRLPLVDGVVNAWSMWKEVNSLPSGLATGRSAPGRCLGSR